jgi:hypothetical protein
VPLLRHFFFDGDRRTNRRIPGAPVASKQQLRSTLMLQRAPELEARAGIVPAFAPLQAAA